LSYENLYLVELSPFVLG